MPDYETQLFVVEVDEEGFQVDSRYAIFITSIISSRWTNCRTKSDHHGRSFWAETFLCTPGIRWWYVFVSPYSLHLRHLRSTKRTIFQKSWNSLLEFPTTQLWFSTIVLRLLRYKVFVWPNCELQNEFMLCPTDPDVDAQKSFVWGDLEADLFSPIFFSYHLTASTTILKYTINVYVHA